jgi:hypothetical protein
MEIIYQHCETLIKQQPLSFSFSLLLSFLKQKWRCVFGLWQPPFSLSRSLCVHSPLPQLCAASLDCGNAIISHVLTEDKKVETVFMLLLDCYVVNNNNNNNIILHDISFTTQSCLFPLVSHNISGQPLISFCCD